MSARSRNFATYLGLSAKTDAVDARMLALCAAKSQDLRPWQSPSKETMQLRGLRRRRDDLAQMIRKEQNRLEHPQIKAVERSLKRHIRALTKEMNELDAQIEKIVADTPEFRRKSDLLTSVIGVGPKTAPACLAHVPELGSLREIVPLRWSTARKHNQLTILNVRLRQATEYFHREKLQIKSNHLLLLKYP